MMVEIQKEKHSVFLLPIQQGHYKIAPLNSYKTPVLLIIFRNKSLKFRKEYGL